MSKLNEKLLELIEDISEENALYEMGWADSDKFLIEIDLDHVGRFLNELGDILDCSIIGDCGYEVTLYEHCICMNLSAMLSGLSDVDLALLFPHDDYIY